MGSYNLGEGRTLKGCETFQQIKNMTAGKIFVICEIYSRQTTEQDVSHCCTLYIHTVL